jgi:hypothetical protein
MKLTRFEKLLAAYGTDIRLWPEKHAKAAQEFLAADHKAMSAMHRAVGLENALLKVDHFPGNMARSTARVMTRAMALIDSLEGFDIYIQPETRSYLPLATLASTALLLFMLGIGLGAVNSSAHPDVATAQLILDGPYRMMASR